MSTLISTPDAPTPVGAYSQAIRAGGALYCAGQIPLDPTTGELVNGDIVTQTRRVLENLRAILAAADLGFGNVVNTTVFLSDMDDYRAMNDTYASFFGERTPARTTVAVSRLPRGARIEINAIALAG